MKQKIFVGSLGASQFIFVEATATQQVPDWAQSHVHMWEYFGGVSQVVVPDNLKTGITKSHRYDPDINVNYQKLGEHYGFAIVPARVYEAKDKEFASYCILLCLLNVNKIWLFWSATAFPFNINICIMKFI